MAKLGHLAGYSLGTAGTNASTGTRSNALGIIHERCSGLKPNENVTLTQESSSAGFSGSITWFQSESHKGAGG